MANVLESIPWARRLKFRHLEVFVALHESGSLTAAAAQLHMTQPALSHWLADIEETVGRPLFHRGRGLVLTEAGKVFLGHAERMLGDVQRTDADLKAVQAGLQGRLHVGTGLPRVLLPRAIARLQEASPGIFVSVAEAPLGTLLERLARREVDMIIGALNAQARQSAFAMEVLLPDAVQIVASRGHPLLRRKEPRWEELEQYPWILPPVGAVMRDVIDEAFAAQHFRPPMPAVEANSSVRVQLLMGERNYLTILSASEVEIYRPFGLFEYVPISPPIPFPDIGVIWEKERESALLSHLLEALRIEARAFVASQTKHVTQGAAG